jgi:putative endopeptidase
MRRLASLPPLVVLVAANISAQSGGVETLAIDKSADPCQDFYQYACGNWMKTNSIPAQYSRWGRFNELQEHNQEILRSILEDSASHQERSPIDQKIGALYAACMDENAAEKAGYDPIKPGLESIRNLSDKKMLAQEVAQLQNQGVTAFFTFRSSPDPDNARTTVGNADQGGLGLPDKSYYVEAKDDKTRQQYVEHVARMLLLIGEPVEKAQSDARAVLAVETELAKDSLDRVARRDPNLIHHKMSFREWQELTPSFDLSAYITTRRSPALVSLNVAVPDFFKGLNRILTSSNLEDLKTYLVWHYVSAYAPNLSKAFVEENFNFYGKFLTGAKELRPRWKRCVEATDSALGEALGQKYVERAFAGASKQKTQELVLLIERQMEIDIDSLTWMSGVTKQQALSKLKGVTNKIGYPAKWRDYSSLSITGTNLLADVRNAREFEVRRNLDKIGKPVDRSEFNMSPPTVNAYYSSLQNNINFPAGILQPPFYKTDADLAVNLGGIGAVIGHELTHGFDDAGRRFDADGNLRDWWQKKDAEEFKKRADCLVNEYSGFKPLPDANLNGRLTLGENGADNAGIRLAFMALTAGLENGSVGKQKLDGYTPEQRFFLGFAQIWCENTRPEFSRNSVRTDPHSPGRFRVDGVVQNMSEFAKAFGCSAGQPMVSAHACRVW